MSLRVVGAGLGRTGTLSLKAALERLLGAPCLPHDGGVHAPGTRATVDRRRSAASRPTGGSSSPATRRRWTGRRRRSGSRSPRRIPKAIILLSTRDSSETWWNSANETIFRGIDGAPAEHLEGHGPGDVRLPLHADIGDRARGDRRVREAQRRRARARAEERGWSSTSPATAGSRCARRSACRFRRSRSRTRTRARSSSSGCAPSARRPESPAVSALLAACGGFLLAVLWMDLIFDTQVLGHRRADGAAARAGARVDRRVLQARDDRLGADEPADRRGDGRRPWSAASSASSPAADALAAAARCALTLSPAPTALAIARVVPNAVRLGARRDDPAHAERARARDLPRPPGVSGRRRRASSRRSSRSRFG